MKDPTSYVEMLRRATRLSLIFYATVAVLAVLAMAALGLR